MKNGSNRSPGAQPAPKARADGLVVQELMDEILVYDLERHQSHCLNQTAALVWRHCDGSSSVAEMARQLHQELGAPVEEEAVWLALNRLSRAHLLQEKVHLPVSGDRATRRAMLRRLAAAGSVALVGSMAVPANAAKSPFSPPAICFTCCCNSGACNGGIGCANGSFNSENCKCCLPNTGSCIGGSGSGCPTCVGDCGGSCPNNTATCFQMPNCCRTATCAPPPP
jgi:hypothetical protein